VPFHSGRERDHCRCGFPMEGSRCSKCSREPADCACVRTWGATRKFRTRPHSSDPKAVLLREAARLRQQKYRRRLKERAVGFAEDRDPGDEHG